MGPPYFLIIGFGKVSKILEVAVSYSIGDTFVRYSPTLANLNKTSRRQRPQYGILLLTSEFDPLLLLQYSDFPSDFCLTFRGRTTNIPSNFLE